MNKLALCVAALLQPIVVVEPAHREREATREDLVGVVDLTHAEDFDGHLHGTTRIWVLASRAEARWLDVAFGLPFRW
jgi:hypothetical protein